MKRVCFFISTSFFTFVIGVLLTWSLPRVPQAARAEPKPRGQTQVFIQRVVKRGRHYKIQFRVVNGSPDPVRYQGYSKDNHCAFIIRPEVGAERQMPCFCGTGLVEQTLLPGEVTTFQMGIAQGYGKAKVGFDFLVGSARRREVVWSADVLLQ